MERHQKFLVFTGASIIAHVAAVILFSALFNDDKNITITATDNFKPLQISMQSTQKNSTADNPNKENTIKKKKLILNPAVSSKISVTEVTSKNVAQTPLPEQKKTELNHSIDIGDSIVARYTAEQNTASAREEPGASQNSEPESKISTVDQVSPDKQQRIENSDNKNAMIRKKLNALVRNNFNYPGFAIKKGWQGTVKLGLRIEANGKLSNVHIVKTSGYKILDQAALITLSNAIYINGIEPWLSGNYFDTTLPVKYHLIDG